MFHFTSGCEEIYDIQFLPDVYRPMILNLEKSAVREAITNPDSSFWLRASNEIDVESGSERGANRTTLPPSSSDTTVGQMQEMGNSLPDSGNQL